MKTYFLLIFAFSLKLYGQTVKGNLFSKKEIEQPLKVKILDLSHKSLKELPSELVKFKNLEEIDLSENPDLDLFESFQLLRKFKKLKSLDLSRVYASIPDNISTLVSIKELDLEKNELTSIPEGVKKLIRLRKLTLWDNKISNISLQPGDLPKLEEIELGLNELTAFPDDLSLIPNLKIISFYHNSISHISPGIKKLLRIDKLDLRGNKLSSLPDEFGELKTIRKLDLRENQLTSITPLLNLIGLEELDIAENKIEEISDKISRLTNLKIFSLSDNPIKAFPVRIRDLQSLNYISIDGYDSATLPAYLSLMATLPQLKTLSIGLSGINKMPPEFEKLTQINSFLIWDCDLIKPERKRLRALYPKANFKFDKSWGDSSFYKYKPCSMNEKDWDSISVDNLKFKYLFVGQSYKYTDDDGIHYWDGEILLNLDKKTIDKETAGKILIAIADRLEVEDIIAARTCRTFEIMHSSLPPKNEEVKKYYEKNFIGKYYRKSGLKGY